MKANYIFEKLKKSILTSQEFRTRTYTKGDKTLHVISLETMCNDDKIAWYVTLPLAQTSDFEEKSLENCLATSNLVDIPNVDKAKAMLANGNSLVLLMDSDFAKAVDTRTTLSRAVVEPPTSVVVKGPREGFVEDLKNNVTLLRKRMKSEDFVVKTLSVGKYTNTEVAVCYVKSIASSDVCNEIIQRITSIDIDGVVDSHYLATYLQPKKSVLFRRVGYAEKPDIVAAKMLEGRVAIVVDGSPIVLTVPYLFVEDLQNVGDYQINSEVTTFSRFFRVIAVLLSILLPAVYVSLQRFNYQIIPLTFLVTILNATENIPFSPLAEMLFVIIMFDILREATLLMPQAAGTALSLVGAVVLGEAAIKAGLLGAPAVMIGALSGIGLYNMPDNTLILSLLRLIVTFLGGFMGLFGVIIAMLGVLAYGVSLDSFGTPYFAPFAPEITNDRQDAIALKPLFKRKKRPQSIKNVNATRMNQDEK